MVIGNADGMAVTANGAANNNNNNNNNNSNSSSHPSGIPQDKIDNIMSGIANTGDVKMNNHRKKLRQRFDIIKKLGQGTYGKVQLGINKETGQEVAIKTIKKCKIEAEADLVRIRREVQIMSSVQHPNIIHIYEVFENREKMVLVMEFAAGGELYDYLSERKVLSETEARRIFRQVATAVYYCHKHKICHRDLKLENILLDEHGNAKIADFGLSNVFDDQRLLATFCGSPLYASPEIVEGTPYHGPEVDCWSLGVLLYTLVYGSMPFDGSNFKRLVKQISEGDYFEPKKPSRASTLIRDMLTVCPRKRATIEQICSHWWVNENDNLSCLDLAEDLANQTPVRLDVLLSLTPSAITADQLVVPSAEANANAKANERVPRSHSVGSIRDISANTEAERRILDMVAAGGEQALMPSPTRTITPAQSPIQPKRKLETTMSSENASGAVKKEKAGSRTILAEEKITPVSEEETPMETEEPLKNSMEEPEAILAASFSQKDMEMVKDLCSQLIQEEEPAKPSIKISPTTEPAQNSIFNDNAVAAKQRNLGKLDSVAEAPEEKEATKVIKKFVNKHKTADMVNTIGQITPDSNKTTDTSAKLPTGPPPFVRKCSLQDETTLNKFNTERRKSRILETAEKFNQLNANAGADKAKKLVIPGVSVGSFKKEFERKATTPAAQGPTAGERRALEEVAAAAAAAKEMEETGGTETNATTTITADVRLEQPNEIKTVGSVAAKEIEQLCAKTENIDVNECAAEPALLGERERKLQNARAIIGNAIQPVIRRPTTPAQPQLPSPSNFYGNGGGGGGNTQLLRNGMDSFNKTVANGVTTTNSEMPINYSHNNNNNNYNNNVDEKVVPPWLKWPKNKQTQPQKSQLQQHKQQQSQHQQQQEYPINNKNKNIALVAARQNIISRLASAPFLPTNNNEPSSLNIPLNNDFNTTCTTQEATAKQQNHYLPQQVMNRIRQLQRHISVPPLLSNSPFYANVPVTATVSAIANANANVSKNSVPKPFYNALPPPTSTTTTTLPLSSPQPLSSSTLFKSSPGGDTNAAPGGMKTSSASITLKSATLPRRKTAKTEIQLEIKPRVVEQQPAMRFTTEMQHPVADLRSAPAREGPVPYSPLQSSAHARANSLEPKEHIIPISRPPTYTRTTSNTTTRSSGSLSRQSTGDSESDTNTTTNMSQSTVTGASQPIKKSPREFIIPIAVEGGGIITPREGSIEPSESSHTTTSSRSTFSRLKPTRRIGSLLNNSAVDEESPFPKMRTSSSTRDTEDDPRFTLHRLRSTRPTKKVSQDNDSASSGEEDDDDGFEILTAENLFSTLLQRVRALTNRMNVNNDITSGFPNSTRLFNSMRSGQSSLFDQDPFRSRLNNTPWRHSMAGRDLDTDMDSIFSRTGATLPRGNKSSKTAQQNVPEATNCYTGNNKVSEKQEEEPLDLADLDLSRLRLSKKDLETLSNIAPGLPKCFQDQLIAKLPPIQARKLSRTLSMQAPAPNVTIYKRSQSSGRGVEKDCQLTSKNTDTNYTAPAGNSRTRNDYEASDIPTPLEICSTKSRSNSVCRDDIYNKSLCMPCESDISEKYKYYSPYLAKTAPKENVPKENVPIVEHYVEMNNSGAAAALPPSGYLSPTSNSIADGQNGSLRRRASQRRISRFLRPDFFEEPLDENPYMREKKLRERETQNVLREIREKSREPSRDRLSNAVEVEKSKKAHKSKASKAVLDTQVPVTAHHVRNKSLELYTEQQSKDALSPQETAKRQRRSLSRPRDIIDGVDKNELADKILQELQLLSEVRNRQEQEKVAAAQKAFADKMTNGFESPAENTATIKKVKKVKVKDKTCEGPAIDSATKTVVKKVKKIVKKNEDSDEVLLANEKLYKAALAETEPVKKESKLKRPKSYPVKELVSPTIPKPELENNYMPSKEPTKPPTAITECEDCEQAKTGLPIAVGTSGTLSRESRLVRPKSYPATKLAPPQQLKKVTRSGVAIPTITEVTTPKSSSVSRQSTSEEKSTSLTPTGKLGENSSSSESRTTAVKKSIKVPKKSKLVPPTPITPTMEDFKERAFKEKSPDKKPKGLLYAIGQKFEKLRDSAMSKEKKANAISTNSSSSTCLAAIKSSSSSESSTPEKIRQPSTLLRKKKSMDCMTPKTDKSGSIADSINSKGTKASNNSSNSEKPPKSEKRSRIDAVIRSIRERSLPRVTSPVKHQTTQLKRALSVEEINTSFNRNAMNKVLGLFRRTDKDSADTRVRSVRSTSNIERNIRESPESPIYQNTQAIKALAATKTTKKYKNIENYCGNSSCSCGESIPATPITSSSITCPDCIQDETAKKLEKIRTDESARSVVAPVAYKDPILAQGNKDKRKGLMLELNKPEKYETEGHVRTSSKAAYINCNGIYSNLPPYPGALKSSSNNNSSQHSMDNTAMNISTNNNNINNINHNNINNNNDNINNNSCLINNNNNSLLQTSSHTSGYHTSSTHEINRNHLLSPSSENIANYSSDSRSYHDDGGSTSTFLSPTDEPELTFDNWSVCSEDNYRRYATPSPTVSRLSRTSQRSSPTRTGGDTSDPNESVIDRIKRRSFYCRFNDKKPKRTSSIVGPNAVRDYYREQQAAVKARSSNKLNTERPEPRPTSPDITHEFFRPLKLSPVGTELKPPIYRSPLEYAMSTASRPRKSLNDIRPIITPNSTSSTAFPTRRYTTTVDRDNDYLSGISNSSASMRYKPSTAIHVYDSPGIPSSNSNYYNTYNPKRRSSYTLNGTLSNGNANIDGYATVGRRGIRAYDQRTLSMHETPSLTNNTTTYRRDTRTPVRDYSSGISRSNSRYRTSATTRSPTNI